MRHLETRLRIIGVDVATQPKSVGLAHCTYSDGRLGVETVLAEPSWDAIDARIGDWLHSTTSDAPTLLALDAPLGWPSRLSASLQSHRAGESLPPVANELFRRRTDDVIANALGKRPLDVGADRIARTAHTALRLLARLRRTHQLAIPLAWQPAPPSVTCAIEVYPAGTLVSRDLPSSGYKGPMPKAGALRDRIIDGLHVELTLSSESARVMQSSDHLLDAVLCCVAAHDFANGRVIEPEQGDLARQEGWIWVAPRS
jgi:predicted RNase H-like nuclease